MLDVKVQYQRSLDYNVIGKLTLPLFMYMRNTLSENLITFEIHVLNFIIKVITLCHLTESHFVI